MKTRIEVDEMGRFILILPEDIVEDFDLDDGDQALLEIEEDLVFISFLS